MPATTLGTFSAYDPGLPADHPLMKQRVLFVRNEQGQDWYDLTASAPQNLLWLGVRDGAVATADEDISKLFPDGMTVYAIARGPDPATLLGKLFNAATGALTDAPPPAYFELFKTDIIGRMTDEQVEDFDAELALQPARVRRMWADCTRVESTHPLYTLLHEQISAKYGEAEANRILARP